MDEKRHAQEQNNNTSKMKREALFLCGFVSASLEIRAVCVCVCAVVLDMLSLYYDFSRRLSLKRCEQIEHNAE